MAIKVEKMQDCFCFGFLFVFFFLGQEVLN